MPAKTQPPIVFTAAVDQDDWDKKFGGWRCSALRIPSAQVDDVFVEGTRSDKSWYEVMHEHAIIRWIPLPPPEKALLSISLTEKLSTQGLTRFWRKLAILLPPGAAIIGALITGIFLYSSRSPSNLREGIAFNLSSPVLAECGGVTINGSAELSAGSKEKITRISWDWGDGVIVDSPFPAIHRFSRNDTYSVKVTAYTSNNEIEGRTIPINITSINPKCR
jgi:hypothetical protein